MLPQSDTGIPVSTSLCLGKVGSEQEKSRKSLVLRQLLRSSNSFQLRGAQHAKDYTLGYGVLSSNISKGLPYILSSWNANGFIAQCPCYCISSLSGRLPGMIPVQESGSWQLAGRWWEGMLESTSDELGPVKRMWSTEVQVTNGRKDGERVSRTGDRRVFCLN